MNRFWTYNPAKNVYMRSKSEPLSAFPTIIDTVDMQVWCRSCRRWENIVAFSQNVLKSGCGKLYTGPFCRDKSVFTYGFDVMRHGGVFHIKYHSQKVATDYRRLVGNEYDLDIVKKRLFKNGKETFERKEISEPLCDDITSQIMDEIGYAYKNTLGIKPTVTSSLKGFQLILGYILCPFNVNFFVISRHWGLNPYDADFTSLSSGDTPDAENEMFESLGLRPTKSLRKMYQKLPQGLIGYVAAKDLGFTDVNLLIKSATLKWYTFFQSHLISFADGSVHYNIRTGLLRFVRDALALSEQKTVWNTINRTVTNFADEPYQRMYITDGINMYRGLAEYLTDGDKREIMKEGFNVYTHDYLLRRQNTLAGIRREDEWEDARAANVHFTIEQAFLNLEYKTGESFRINPVTKAREAVPDEDRYCFYVAKNSLELKEIGSEMHNCVGWGYSESVLARRATIVYAMYKKRYKICIEVSPAFTIRQAFGPCNSELTGEALEAFAEWCKEKNIVRKKVFNVHCAP